MKKFLSITLAAVMALSLAGCGNSGDTSVSLESSTPSAVESSVKNIFDMYDYENDEVFYTHDLKH